MGSQLQNRRLVTKEKMPTTDVDEMLTFVGFVSAFCWFHVAFRTRVETLQTVPNPKNVDILVTFFRKKP